VIFKLKFPQHLFCILHIPNYYALANICGRKIKLTVFLYNTGIECCCFFV